MHIFFPDKRTTQVHLDSVDLGCGNFLQHKRLHVPRRMINTGQTEAQEAADQLSSLEEQMEHQENSGTTSLDPRVNNPQRVQLQDDVLVETSIQLEEVELVSSQEEEDVPVSVAI